MAESYSRQHSLLICKKCGKEMSVRNDYFPHHSGICLSCQKKGTSFAQKHGCYKTRLYKIWLGLSHRRYNTRKPSICPEWKDFSNFKEWAFANGYSDNLTIDRIDNTGNYEPSNCQWITRQENARKDKIIFSDLECVNILHQRKMLGVTQKEMAKYLGVSRNTIQRAERRAKEYEEFNSNSERIEM